MGRVGFWHDFSERVRKGRMPRWAYLFVPWYAEPKKYRRHAEDDWTPNEQTMQMAWAVHETSKAFVGHEVTLTRDQLKWHETSYQEAIENNALNLFLSNYSITPEQSFQSTSLSAISPEVLDYLRNQTKIGVPYEFEGL